MSGSRLSNTSIRWWPNRDTHTSSSLHCTGTEIDYQSCSLTQCLLVGRYLQSEFSTHQHSPTWSLGYGNPLFPFHSNSARLTRERGQSCSVNEPHMLQTVTIHVYAISWIDFAKTGRVHLCAPSQSWQSQSRLDCIEARSLHHQFHIGGLTTDMKLVVKLSSLDSYENYVLKCTG